MARGARRSRRRFGSNLELLSRVRLTYFEKEGVDLARVESADLLESFYNLQADPERGAVLACFAEVADAFAREQQEDEAFFRLMHVVLQAVKGGLDLEWAGRYFELWTLKLHGVLPPLTQCGRCGAAMGEGGGQYQRREAIVTCRRCGGRHSGDPKLPAAAVTAAAEILKRAPAALIGRPVDLAALAPLRALSTALFFDLTEKRFRSYDVLEQLRRVT